MRSAFKINLKFIIIFGCLYFQALEIFAQPSKSNHDSTIVFDLYQAGLKVQKSKPVSFEIYLSRAVKFAESHNTISTSTAQSYYLLGTSLYRKSKYQEALDIFQHFENISDKLKNSQLLFMANNAIANVYIEQAKTDIALKYYQKCLAIATSSANKENEGIAYNNIAFVYKDAGKYDNAISYIFKSIEVNERINNKLGLGNNYLQLSVIYLRKADNNMSLQYAQKCLVIFNNLKRMDLVGITHNILSAAYEALKNLGQARNEAEKSISISRNMNDQRAMAINLIRLGDLLYTDGLYTEALSSYLEGNTFIEKIHLQRSHAYSLLCIGKTFFKLNNLNESEKYLKMGLDESIRSSQPENINLAYKELSFLYQALKKDSLAIDYLYKYNSAKDSLMTRQTSDKLAELQTKYETEKKQKQIEQLNSQTALQASDLKNKSLSLSKSKLEIDNQTLALQKTNLELNNQHLELSKKEIELNNEKFATYSKEQHIKLLNNKNKIQQLEIVKRNATIIIIIILFLIAVLVGYQLYSRYQFKQAAQLQSQKILHQELTSKGIIDAEERERKRIAAELHDGIGQLFTAVKMNMEILVERFLIKQPEAHQLAATTMSLVDESCLEVRSIAHQMMPNALIKSGLVSALRDFVNKVPSDRLKINIETKGIDKGLDGTTETVLYRVIQESVNNVIKHSNATSLDILLLSDQKEITVSIEDNGKGFDMAEKKNFKGIGLKNIISRVEYLKGTVEISSSLGKGTLVSIFIPLA